MAEIDRFRPEDRRGVDTLFRRTHGPDAAEAQALRWDWQHRRNPFNPGGQPRLWVAREGPTVIGHFPTLPVRLSLRGMNVDATWGSEAYVTPERESLALDEALIRSWDRNTGAALTLGVQPATRAVYDRLHWPASTALPCLVKPLTRRALRLPSVPLLVNQLISAPQFDLAVRRDAAYLNWRYIELPHVRYAVVALKREGEVHGYAVYRHLHEPLGRVTLLVDLLVAPNDVSGLKTLLRWVDREARAEDTDKVRCFMMHAGFRKVLKRNGYFQVKSGIDVAVKVNAVEVPTGFYDQTDGWHITFGDSDQDH